MDKFRKRAKEIFHQAPECYNCAQSVAAVSGRMDLVPEYRACGGGSVEGNTCGALYAALQIVAEDKRDEVLEAFKKGIGATTCQEIKGVLKTPCEECVALGAFLVDSVTQNEPQKNDL